MAGADRIAAENQRLPANLVDPAPVQSRALIAEIDKKR